MKHKLVNNKVIVIDDGERQKKVWLFMIIALIFIGTIFIIIITQRVRTSLDCSITGFNYNNINSQFKDVYENRILDLNLINSTIKCNGNFDIPYTLLLRVKE